MSGLYTAITAAALSAVGTGVSAYNQNQTMRKQDSQAASNLIKQQAINSQATQKVDQLNSAIAKSNPDDARKQQTAAYLEALNRAAPTQGTVTPATKGASKRFAQATAGAQQDVSDYARSTANNLAATAAPSLQRINEGNAIAGTASGLGLLNDQSNNQQGIFRTQLAGDANDPWLGALSGLLQGAGAGASTYAGGRSGATKNPYLSGGG